MNVLIKPGNYVVAVSGGVDSAVLLDLLKKRPGLKLTVAHFDHGIRPDSHKDNQFVKKLAAKHNLPFIQAKGELGANASEEKARNARYDFLHKVKEATGAKAIITAHHQDDLLETAVLNLLRGTGRRGLTSLKSTDNIVRPLLGYTKERIVDYAAANKLNWREDSTNQDIKFRRNYIRHNILSKLSLAEKMQLVILLERLEELNERIDSHLITFLHVQPSPVKIKRSWFINLPYKLSNETLHFWLKNHGVSNLNQRLIDRLTVAVKTAAHGTSHSIDKNHTLKLTKNFAELVTS